MAPIERRKARSHLRTEAVRLYLEMNAARAGVRAVALAGPDGRLIGGVGDADLDALAAVGPMFVSGSPVNPAFEARIDEVVKNHDLYASALRVGTTTLVLTSIGSRFPEQRRAERAFARIFSA